MKFLRAASGKKSFGYENFQKKLAVFFRKIFLIEKIAQAIIKIFLKIPSLGFGDIPALQHIQRSAGIKHGFFKMSVVFLGSPALFVKGGLLSQKRLLNGFSGLGKTFQSIGRVFAGNSCSSLFIH